MNIGDVCGEDDGGEQREGLEKVAQRPVQAPGNAPQRRRGLVPGAGRPPVAALWRLAAWEAATIWTRPSTTPSVNILSSMVVSAPPALPSA